MGKKTKTIVTGLKRTCIGLLLGANLCTIALLWCCVLLTFVSAEQCPRLSLLTLAFPAFLIVNAVFLVVWLLVHCRLAWLPLAGMLPIAGYILDYCPLHLPTPSEVTTDSTLTIVSYNVGKVSVEEEQADLLTFLTLADADIICMQEVRSGFLTEQTTKDWLQEHPYHTLFNHNELIMSRFPILGDSIPITYPTRSNHSTACWIDYKGDSVLIINNHLESNHLQDDEKSEYTNMIKDPHRSTLKSGSRMMIRKLSQATGFRAAQCDTLCAMLDSHSRHATILCGDLNDTPVSYTYQRIASRLSSAYRQGGTGPGFSYSQRAFPVRIDHIFFSDRWTCTYSRIDRGILASDHYPIIAHLQEKVQ